MLTLIIAEAALETIPKQLWKHPSVTKHAISRRKKPGDIILDRSYHHAAMLGMKDNQRRGRPDLIHSVLLEATATPLFFKNNLNIWVHTYDNKVIYFKKNIRLPKSYFRFEGLIEQLFKEKKIV
ncbi:ribosome biogenesis protein, partial [Thermoproteota archaeon]